ncbi:MAG: YtxH domain-containing protein [Arthrobacter sp.]
MKNKLLLGVGIAAGYVLGSRSGRAAYDKLKARAAGIWDSKPVQDKVTVATEAIKEKAPEVADQLTEAARRAGTVIGSAMHRDGSPGSSGDGKSSTSDGAKTAGDLSGDHVPSHSTHPETLNLDTSSGEAQSKA